MNKHLLTISLLALGFNAHVLGGATPDILLGVNYWQQSYSGYIKDLEANNPLIAELNVNSDLALDDDTDLSVYAALEHSVPLLPNVRVQRTAVENDGNNQLSRSIEFDNKVFLVSDTIRTGSDLSHLDVTLYYQVLSNIVSFDLGITARWFDGHVEVANSSEIATQDIDVIVPLAHIGSRIQLPLTGLFIGASANALGDGDSNLTDYTISLGYESFTGLGLEAGYRSMDLTLDDVDSIDAELTIDGSYLGLFYHF